MVLCLWASVSYPLQFPIQSHQYLVGGFNHLETYESQMGRIIPYIMEKT